MEGINSDDIVKKISEGLAGRQWLILVMTPAALASPWVQREVTVALSEQTAGRMLGVVPVVMQPCRDQDVPLLWRTLHRQDATRDYATARGGLFKALGLPGVSTPAPRAAAHATTLPQQRTPTGRAVPPVAVRAQRPVTKRIYVSYADEDHVLAARLVKSLNDQLMPGREMAWRYSTRKAYENNKFMSRVKNSEASTRLLESPIFIVILSPDADTASYVGQEIKQAQLSDKAIVPVLFRDCRPGPALAALPPVSFLPTRPYDDALAELVTHLRSV